MNNIEEKLFHLINTAGSQYEQYIEYINQIKNINYVDKLFHRSYLHVAIQARRKDIIIDLLARGIDVDIQDKNGNTAAAYLASSQNWDLLNILLPYIKKINLRDNIGNNLLWDVIFYSTCRSEKRYEMVSILLKMGADANNVNKRGNTPKVLAEKQEDMKLVELLNNTAGKAIIKEENNNYIKFQYDDKKVNLLVQALVERKTETVLKLLKENKEYCNYVVNNKDICKEQDEKSIFQIALDCGCDADIFHMLIEYGVDINGMFHTMPFDFRKKQDKKVEEPVIQGVMKSILLVAGLGNYEYADSLFGVAIHLIDKGANLDKKDSDGYTAWMKVLTTAQMISEIIPDRKNEGIFLTYLSRCLHLLMEYKADIWETSSNKIYSIEDIVYNIQNGKDVLSGLKSESATFLMGTGEKLLEVIKKYYFTDYDTIINERSKIIHNILGEERYLLRSEIVERMENGDKDLIKEIAKLFIQENTEEGNSKAKQLLQLS